MNKKILIYIILILAAVIGGFFLFRSSWTNSSYIAPEQSSQQSSSPVNNIKPTVTSASAISSMATQEEKSSKIRYVSVINFSFNPKVLNISKGDSVIWRNQDSAPHQIAGANLDGPVMSNGQSYTFVFNSAGTFDYHCAIHPSMTGTILVK
ncbi:MAG: cupredoxin domain-containing protein [Patescibacteria group bacterium]|nr:cupredoxin domain-containing protein [Patescibacteria group bacterium]